MAFAELGRIRLETTTVDGVLQRVADLAQRAIPGAEEVSVTLVRDRHPSTAASTGPLALTLDEWQYQHHQGPCLDAAADQGTISVTDLNTDHRWPGWLAQARTAGVRSSLSLGLPVQEKITGALNIYATTTHAFDEDAILVGKTFAGYAAVALANAHLYDTTADLAEHTRKAMENRAVIEQAKGIIMFERRCTPDEAFTILSQISQDANCQSPGIVEGSVKRLQPSWPQP